MYKVIVAGTRTFNDYKLLATKLDYYLSKQTDIVIVSGTANGADKLGEKYAQEHNLPVKRFPANWNKYGKVAGPIRNAQMADYADACIVFWDGKSKGTKSMIDLAERAKLPLRVVKY